MAKREDQAEHYGDDGGEDGADCGMHVRAKHGEERYTENDQDGGVHRLAPRLLLKCRSMKVATLTPIQAATMAAAMMAAVVIAASRWARAAKP
jgi:hypothetical protein